MSLAIRPRMADVRRIGCRRALARWSGRCLRVVAVVAAICCASGSRVTAQTMPAPAEIQAPLLVRILAFERTLRERVGDTLVIGVLYQSRHRPSLLAQREFLEAVRPFDTVSGIPTLAVGIELNGDATLRGQILAHQVDVLYVTPLRAMTLDTVRAVARDVGLLTFSGVPQFVIDGLCVGIDVRGDRPEILVNRKALASSRIEFSAQLLKLASIVDSDDGRASRP